jgi:hypothetical protein
LETVPHGQLVRDGLGVPVPKKYRTWDELEGLPQPLRNAAQKAIFTCSKNQSRRLPTHFPGQTRSQGPWVPAEVRQFYDTQGRRQEVLNDPPREQEWEYISDLMMDAYHTWLRQTYRKVPAPSRYISDLVKEKAFERDNGQCVKCGSTRDLQDPRSPR